MGCERAGFIGVLLHPIPGSLLGLWERSPRSYLSQSRHRGC